MTGCLTPPQVRFVKKVAYNLSKKSAFCKIVSLQKMFEIQSPQTFGGLAFRGQSFNVEVSV